MELKEIILKDRIIQMHNIVAEDSVSAIIEKIYQINVDDEQWKEDFKNTVCRSHVEVSTDFDMPHIQLLLSSYGGGVYDGLGLYDVIKSSSTPIDIVCSGKIMSMGIIILLASKNRIAYKNTTFMIHQVSSWMCGKLEDMEEDVAETKRLNNLLFKIISDTTNISKEKLKEIKKLKKDWYITAEEALELGLINKII